MGLSPKQNKKHNCGEEEVRRGLFENMARKSMKTCVCLLSVIGLILCAAMGSAKRPKKVSAFITSSSSSSRENIPSPLQSHKGTQRYATYGNLRDVVDGGDTVVG